MEQRPQQLSPTVLIATLGSEPQVVTTALDLLLMQGEIIHKVHILHTVTPVETPISNAVEILRNESNNPPYIGNISFQFHALCDERGHPLTDVEAPEATRAAFRYLYRLVWTAKQAGERVHLLIAGGRKTLAVFGMTTAQILFDESDCLWHLYSGGEFLSSKRLHPQPGENVRLIPIPVILWSNISPALGSLAQVSDPFEAAERIRQL